MASYGWRDRRSVAAALYDEGHRFSFLQAVRLLEEMAGGEDDREVVRFRSAVRLDYPPTDIEEVRRVDAEGRTEMTVNVLGLAGALGPLPPPVSELIVERAFRRDTAFRDFLDIFNHRLVSLLYRARKRYRPALDSKSPEHGRVATVLHALLGLATPHLLARMDLPDRALLPYAGLIVDRHRSTVGLIRVLEDYFEVAIAIVPFRGAWNPIEDVDQTRIGLTGANQLLGRNAALGGRVWDEEAAIEVCLGALTLDQFLAFLPIGRSHRALLAAVRFYLREELGFWIRLRILAAEVPELRIGRDRAAYLGWTTWLRTRPLENDDAQVRLRRRA